MYSKLRSTIKANNLLRKKCTPATGFVLEVRQAMLRIQCFIHFTTVSQTHGNDDSTLCLFWSGLSTESRVCDPRCKLFV